mgnify:CR=1 FL=1
MSKNKFSHLIKSEVQDNGDEDCLSVTISVAKSVMESGETVPIVFYIHGGSLHSGGNQKQFNRLVRMQNVMVVAVAYRLGQGCNFLHFLNFIGVFRIRNMFT